MHNNKPNRIEWHTLNHYVKAKNEPSQSWAEARRGKERAESGLNPIFSYLR